MTFLLALAQVVPPAAVPPVVPASFDLSSWTPANVGTLITLIIGGVVTIIGAWKLAKIEAHVNSEKTRDSERALAKDSEIALLREVLAERRQTASMLAQATAQGIKDSSPVHVVTESEQVPVHLGPTKVEVVNTADAPVPVETATKEKP